MDLDFRLDNNLELYQHDSSNGIHFIEKYLILSATCVTSLTWKCVPIVQPSTSGDRWSICWKTRQRGLCLHYVGYNFSIRHPQKIQYLGLFIFAGTWKTSTKDSGILSKVLMVIRLFWEKQVFTSIWSKCITIAHKSIIQHSWTISKEIWTQLDRKLSSSSAHTIQRKSSHCCNLIRTH